MTSTGPCTSRRFRRSELSGFFVLTAISSSFTSEGIRIEEDLLIVLDGGLIHGGQFSEFLGWFTGTATIMP